MPMGMYDDGFEVVVTVQDFNKRSFVDIVGAQSIEEEHPLLCGAQIDGFLLRAHVSELVEYSMSHEKAHSQRRMLM